MLLTTSLVNEVYHRPAGQAVVRHRDSRVHSFAAAEAMCRIPVENARRKGREQHGGGRRRSRRKTDPA
jgi:hypothetical protein